MTTVQTLILGVYFVLLGLFATYGIHKYYLIALYFLVRKRKPHPLRHYGDRELPPVTVQLPIYNESAVVERLLDAVAGIRYPRDRFEVQVLDDSTDETTAIVHRRVEELRETGLAISHVRRGSRLGFKAALEAGMASARGELLAIFDADFIPRPNFLEKTVHHFTDPGVGLVQQRWEHLNRDYSLLTRLQAIYLDGAFVIESTTRNRTGAWLNFNGTAGIWRRQAILDGGGWEHDTITEDLDLSFRSQLAGWRAVYLLDETTPAELPIEMNAFKNQQHRWGKGTTQTMRKLLPRIWRARLPLKVKREATVHLTSFLAYPLMLLLFVLMLPATLIRLEHNLGFGAMLYDMLVFLSVTVSFFFYYMVSQWKRGAGWRSRVLYLPFIMSLGVGLVINNTRAVFEAFLDNDVTFVRTPKYGSSVQRGKGRIGRYRGARNWQPFLELALVPYFLTMLYVSLHHHMWMGIPFTALFLGGILYIGGRSIAEAHSPGTA